MTRCLAKIEEMLVETEYHVYIACGKAQNDFAREYLAQVTRDENRIQFSDINTDVGLINKPYSLVVDTKELEKELFAFIESWDEVVEKECLKLQGKKVERVINDISPIGVLVGERLGVENIAISNFTWAEQYERLDINQEITRKFREVYGKLDLFIEYELSLPMDRLKVPKKRTGFNSRKIDYKKVAKICEKYGNELIFLTCGKSASLQDIHIKHFQGCVFTTSGINVIGDVKVVPLPVDTLDTHNYVAASQLVIAKAGWGTISEAMAAQTKLILIERPSVYEDTYNISMLKKRGLADSITEEELQVLDISKLLG